MWIVRLALRRPYTFTVVAILIVLLGIVTIARMSTDIFPNINIPVVSVIWSYSGVAPEEMEKRFVTVCERAMTTTVNDIGLNFIRTQLATVQGAQVPLPYGGKSRQIMVDIDPAKLYGKGLSPTDVSNAINVQNVILPAGTQKIGDREYNVRLNSSPQV